MNAVQLMSAVKCSYMTAASWASALDSEMHRFGIESLDEQAAFIAQCAHESARFSKFEEDLNYSAQRLMAVWPKRFPDLRTASYYAHSPQKLANYVYCDRMGNGPESSGDGWLFRGRGIPMITGRTNYYVLGVKTGLPLMTMPDMLLDIGPAARVAVAYWVMNDLSNVLNLHGFDAVSRAINLGKWDSPLVPNGNADRQALFAQVRHVLAVGL